MIRFVLISAILFSCVKAKETEIYADEYNFKKFDNKTVSQITVENNGRVVNISFTDGDSLKIRGQKYTLRISK